MSRPGSIFAVYTFIAATFFAGCERPERSIRAKKEPASAPPSVVTTPPLKYPVDHALQDQRNRTIQAVIVGRSMERVFFIRSTDGLKAGVPINQLSPRDQAFVLSLPLQPPPSDFFQGDQVSKRPEMKAAPDLNEAYVSSREADIAQLERDKEVIRREIHDSISNLQKRNLQTKLDKIEKEIARLQAQIEERLERPR